MGDGKLLVDRFQKAEQTLTIILSAGAENLLGRFLPVLAVDANRAGRLFENRNSGLLHSHESRRRNPHQQRFILL